MFADLPPPPPARIAQAGLFAQSGPRWCRTGRTLADSRRARAWFVDDATFACDRRTRQSWVLGRIGDRSASRVRLAGRYAGWASIITEQSRLKTSDVRVLSLRTGRYVTVTSSITTAAPSNTTITDLELAASPTPLVAWVAEATDRAGQVLARSVNVKPASGAATTLATGLDVSRSGLRLSTDGASVTWRQGGRPRSASVSAR